MSSTHDIVPDGDVVLILQQLPTENPSAVPDHATQTNQPDGTTAESPPSEEIRVRVSSTHLSSVSAYFKAMFNSHFVEGNSLHQDGFVEVTLLDDYPPDVLLLLKIAYSVAGDTPILDSDTFESIASLMEKYLFDTDLVIPHLARYYSQWEAETENAEEEDDDEFSTALLRVCLSRIVKDEKNFKKSTRRVLVEVRDRISSRLPIPDELLGE
jgi:hypothetical protein